MENKPQTTFIPTKPLTSVEHRHASISVFSLIAFVIFLGALIFSGGLFVYKATLAKEIDNLKQQLEKSKEVFDASFISTIVRVNSRMETGKQLLQKHVAITPIFDLLERNTLVTVTFKDFSFLPASEGKLLIAMKGVAKNYDSIAQQSDEFGKTKYLRDVIFSDLKPDKEGNIEFTFSATLDQKVIMYEETIKQSASTTPN